ncbi:MAG: MerR family transcriptional regulator [Dehalococcoidia bacterium]|nr:MerR family transcriptional regulator [Chloroflexota bacterium]OUW95456.1 MAG: hypothetical protein CBD90_03855 [Chloroflexi bacterium TMED230]RZP13637.1 MAG: MerR family transcriptional regulator [Chloroflexota bacterium]
MISFSREEPVYAIGIVSKIVGLHQQTLRNYERWNLVIPFRSPGGTRYYSIVDIEKIEKVKDWIEKFGINRAGIEIITDLLKEINELEKKNNFLESELIRYKSRGSMMELPENNRRQL